MENVENSVDEKPAISHEENLQELMASNIEKILSILFMVSCSSLLLLDNI